MSKTFRPWAVDDAWLLPPSVHDFVPSGHPAHLVRDLVCDELDLSRITSAYSEPRGYPPYHSGMMVALLLYAYSEGVYSSRRIARACEERFCQLSRLHTGHMAGCRARLGGLQDAERDRRSAHVTESSRSRRNVLAHAGSAAQEVSEFVVAPAIAPC
jgi:hypothetical protein